MTNPSHSPNNPRRIALFLANPNPDAPLSVDTEWRRIDAAIRRSRHCDALRVTDFSRPTREQLHNAVLDGFDVIHVASHGREEGFELHGSTGPELVSLGEFSELVSNHAPRDRPVQCVVLNACWSSEIGTRRALRVPYTIAMQEEISDTAAIEFSAGFYDALGAGHDFAQCFNHGRLRGQAADQPFRPILLEPRNGVLGIRSYVLDAEDLEAQTECSLQLDSGFDGRFPRPPHTWSSVGREIAAFCRDTSLRHRFRTEQFQIHLDCHLSIALVAGHQFGFEAPIAPLQGRHDKHVWRRAGTPPPVVELAVRSRGRTDAPELALSLSITHDIVDDVDAYLRTIGLDYQLRDLSLPLPSARSVADAEHADAIAEAVIRQLRAARAGRPDRLIHLFMAAPVALVFLIGQHQHALGRIRVYEFDFTHQATSSYSPSFELPLALG